jgi:molybdopterin/thiamine biosynthesis adenylyltransferase
VRRERKRALLVGVGGLGCPAALALARSGIGGIGLCDDDTVEPTNLHRQILFGAADLGVAKLEAAARALREIRADLPVYAHPMRLLPDNALALVGEYDVVLEGSDNFATKFLAADACALAGVPIVHASAVRWVGTALAVSARARPCYRCLFEDVPTGDAPNCAEAGVMGPVAGIIAAAQVDLALAFIDGDPVGGQLVTFDGWTKVFRRRTLVGRDDCTLCGRTPRIQNIEPLAYTSPACAG